LATGNLDALAKYGKLLYIHGEDPHQVVAAMRGRPAVLATESFALRFNRKTGDWIVLDTPTGRHRVQIVGVYYDYASEQGYLVLPRHLYQQYYGNDRVSNVALYLKPGTDPVAIRSKLLQSLGRSGRVNITTNRELRQEVLRIFDNTFSITYALHLIAIAVALLGVLNTLIALVLESRRDFGILRSLGATRQTIQRVVMAQALILGMLGNLTGLGVGFLLALLLINVINRQSFGWTIQWVTPWIFLLQSFGLVLLSSAVAGWLPAQMAARMPAPQALREE
jgi:putative ABC transport system permease protein